MGHPLRPREETEDHEDLRPQPIPQVVSHLDSCLLYVACSENALNTDF
jgi:hypothetical protein